MLASGTCVVGALVVATVVLNVSLFHREYAIATSDILKLALQVLGAIAIARLTVIWSIGNFRPQKRWERNASTFAAALSALREMKRMNDILWAGAIHDKQYAELYLADVRERSVTARKKFDEAAANAIFLPEEISSIILRLEAELANGNCQNCRELLDSERCLLEIAMKELDAKKHLI